MLVKEMNRQECEELLSRQGFGRLACVSDNQPYIVPLYFASAPSCLYGFATMGQKIEWMRENPEVCVEADEVRSHKDWASVVLRGRYEEFPDTPQYAKQREEAQSILAKPRALWWETGFASAQTRERFDRDITVIYCIHIEEISGRYASTDPVS